MVSMGTETSKYHEERKLIKIPSVVASESGSAQTADLSSGVVGPHGDITESKKS
jgi:hypothetical protein